MPQCSSSATGPSGAHVDPSGCTSAVALLEHWGISPRYITTADLEASGGQLLDALMAGAPDVTARVQAAMNGHEGELVLTGFVLITDKVTIPRTCTIGVIGGQRTNGGFYINAGFNLAASHCLALQRGEPGPSVNAFTMYFYQPAVTGRADLIAYPCAIDASDAARSQFANIRVTLGINGFDLSDSPTLSNPGGIDLTGIECGCFGENFIIGDAYDFVNIGTFRAWPFMFPGRADLMAVWTDGQTVAFRAERVDGLVVNSLTSWRAKVVLGRADLALTLLSAQVQSMVLDAPGSWLELAGGKTVIGMLYTSKDGNEAQPVVWAKAGRHDIMEIDARVSSIDAFRVDAGAELAIHSGTIVCERLDRTSLVANGGRLTIGPAVTIHWPDTGPLTAPVAEQRAGGQLQWLNPHIGQQQAWPSTAVVYASDHAHNICQADRLHPHTASFNTAWRSGSYSSRAITLRNMAGSGVEIVGAYGTGTVWSRVIRRARGLLAAPVAVEANDDTAYDQSDGWTGFAYQAVVQWRSRIRARSGIALRGMLDLFVANASGTMTTVATFRDDNTTFHGNVVVAGSLTLTGELLAHLPGPFANDAAAATGGVAIDNMYRVTGGTIAWRQV